MRAGVDDELGGAVPRDLACEPVDMDHGNRKQSQEPPVEPVRGDGDGYRRGHPSSLGSGDGVRAASGGHECRNGCPPTAVHGGWVVRCRAGFCGERGIAAEVEVLPAAEVSTAFARLARNEVRYRFVLDMREMDEGVVELI
jgi:hypothetical protein